MIIFVVFGIVLTLILPVLLVCLWRRPRWVAFWSALSLHFVSLAALAAYGGTRDPYALILGSGILALPIGVPLLLLLNWVTRKKAKPLNAVEIDRTFG